MPLALPPSNEDSSHILTILSAISIEICLSPIDIRLASLCSLASLAVSSDQHTAQRIPFTLFAAIASPLPLPPSTIPNVQSLFATASAAGRIKMG